MKHASHNVLFGYLASELILSFHSYSFLALSQMKYPGQRTVRLEKGYIPSYHKPRQTRGYHYTTSFILWIRPSEQNILLYLLSPKISIIELYPNICRLYESVVVVINPLLAHLSSLLMLHHAYWFRHPSNCTNTSRRRPKCSDAT